MTVLSRIVILVRRLADSGHRDLGMNINYQYENILCIYSYQ